MNTPPKSSRTRFIFLLTLMASLAILIFVIYKERQTVRGTAHDTDHYGELLSSYLWDLNREDAKAYVTIIAEEGQFNSVCIMHPDGSSFVEYRAKSYLSEPEQLLRSMNLIRDIHSEERIMFKGQSIGEISTVRANKNIYTYLTISMLALLSISVATLIKQGKHNKFYQQKAEHDLSENRERLHTVVSASPVISFSLDSNGIFTVCEGMGLNKLNNQSLNIIGKSLEEVAKQMPTSKEDFLRALEGNCFSEIRSTDGRNFETWYSPIRENCTIVGVTGVATDVTAVMHAMNSLDDIKRSQNSELNLAQRAHQAFLPSTAPQLEGYEIGMICKPAESIGGDYINFSQTSSNSQLAITFAEVSGHGVSSALLTSIFHTQLCSVMEKSHQTLDEKFLDINSLVHERFPEGRFASTFHTVIDSSNDTMSYVKASREPAVLYSGGSLTKIIDKGGPALGLLPSDLLNSSSYEEHQLNLRSGDTLLLYSDGLVEVEDRAGRMLERKNIIAWGSEEQHLTPQGIADSLYRKVISHTAGADIEDDISILVIRKS